MQDRRKFARIDLATKVRIVVEGVDARHQLFVDNVSAGGLFIRMEQPRPVGSTIHFEFLVRDGGPRITGSGIVQWVNERPGKPPGMGIKFIELNDEGRKEILAVLREKKAVPDGGW